MEWVWCALGVVVVIGALLDMVATVIAVSGGHAWISASVSRGIWRSALALHRRRPSHSLLRAAGPAAILGITVVWTVLLVVGWAMIFSVDGAMSSQNATDVGAMDLLDHAASMVLGGSSPLVAGAEQPWSLLSRLARFTGLGLASLGVAYALPVVGSVVRYRRVARSISSLDGASGTIASTARLEGDQSVVHLFLINLSSDLAQLAEELRAYPVVPFFHSLEPDSALSLAFDKLNGFLEQRDPEDTSVPESVTQPLVNSIDGVLAVVDAFFLPRSLDADGDDPVERRRERIAAWRVHDGW